MKGKHSWLTQKLLPIMAISLAIASTSLLSCTSGSHTESDRQLRQQAAQATETVKRQSQEALANARVAAANAEQKVNDLAAGVKEGVQTRGARPSSRVNLNTAPARELESLPGVSAATAKRIVGHRPYADTHQLVDRGLLTQAQYDAISPRISTR